MSSMSYVIDGNDENVVRITSFDGVVSINWGWSPKKLVVRDNVVARDRGRGSPPLHFDPNVSPIRFVVHDPVVVGARNTVAGELDVRSQTGVRGIDAVVVDVGTMGPKDLDGDIA